MISTKAKVFADTRDMSREEWLEKRRQGIGGSDVSALLGLNPYSSPMKVYLDKIGKLEEQETNEAMRQGTDLEDYVASRFCEDTGKKVKRVNRILQHPEFPWMLANIDRDIVGEDAGLECKTCSPYSKFKFDEGEINPHYYWQAMHYMAVTGAPRWYVAILVLGKEYVTFCVERDEAAVQTLVDVERNFWQNNVIANVPPLPTGSESDGEAIDSIYPNGEIEDQVMPLDDMVDRLNLRGMLMEQRDKLDAQINEIDQSVKLAMGTFERASSGMWKIRWTNSSTSRVDTKLLRAKYPQIAEEVTKTSTGRRYTVTKLKGDNTDD